MSARTKARKRALDLLYAAEMRGMPVEQLLVVEAEKAVNEPERQASWLYAREIVDGIVDHRAEIDELITTHARGWTLERMPAVDRALLRIGVWEIVYNDEVPDAVAIAEAVEAATVLSTDDSAGFVNGLLAAVAPARACRPGFHPLPPRRRAARGARRPAFSRARGGGRPSSAPRSARRGRAPGCGRRRPAIRRPP